MLLSDQGADFIAHHEGFVPRYYLDPIGVGTIGHGFTWRSAAFRTWWQSARPGQAFGPGATISREEAHTVLRLLVSREYGPAVLTAIGKERPQHVFDGAASATYNLGAGALGWGWARALARADYAEAARLLKQTGTTAGGRRLAGLVARRLDEAELIESGDYTVGRPPVLRQPVAPVLRLGERGDAVGELQRDLAALGFDPGKPDAVFGRGTQSAVLAFQRAHGLKADGVAGEATLAALRAAA